MLNHTVEVNAIKCILILLELSQISIYILILAHRLYLLLYYLSLTFSLILAICFP